MFGSIRRFARRLRRRYRLRKEFGTSAGDTVADLIEEFEEHDEVERQRMLDEADSLGELKDELEKRR